MEENLERIVIEEEKPQEIFLEFNKPTFNHSTIKKGIILTAGSGLMVVKTAYRGEEQRPSYIAQFYHDPKDKDLFLIEEKSAEEYLAERAEKFGRIVSNKDYLLTVEPEELTDQKLFFYCDKATREKRKLDCRQFGAGLVVEGKPKEGELLVVRQGKVMTGEQIKHFAYLAVFDENRESYVMDSEKNNHKRWKNFCQQLVN